MPQALKAGQGKREARLFFLQIMFGCSKLKPYLCTITIIYMNNTKAWMLATILTLCGCSIGLSSCKSGKNVSETSYPLVAGTLEEAVKSDSAPARILEAMEKAERFHSYEIMSDTLHSVCVEAIGEVDSTPTEGYGIVVEKGTSSTTFHNLSNARQPKARYDTKTGTLWFANCAMWGTGVQVERLYQIHFDKGDKAHIANTIDPYDIQQQLCQRLGYSIEGEQVTLYDSGREIARATNTITDMGGFDSEQPLWIGEHIQYDLSGNAPLMLITPGVKFTTGLVLTYDDMPTLAAPLAISKDGKVSIGELKEYEK